MAYESINYEVAEQILTITLNRPDKLNAFNASMQKELIEAFDAADADDNVRAIIVTGAGRGFCAGADLSSGADTFDRDARRGPVKRLASGKVDYSDPNVRDGGGQVTRSEEHTSELQSRPHLVCRLLLEKKNSHYQTSIWISE